jgi:hypothetical protein
VSAVIEGDSQCGGCSVSFSRLGTLGQLTDSALLGGSSFITRDASGRFISGPTDAVGEAAIFDSLGSSSAKFGRHGDGPGELGRVLVVQPWLADSVLVIQSFRFSFLDGPRGTGRSVKYAASLFPSYGITLLRDSLVLLNNHDRSTAQFVAFDGHGNLVSGMGVPAGNGDHNSRAAKMAAAKLPHLFWAGTEHYQHRFELWNFDGRLVRSFKPEPKWFTPSDSVQLHRSLVMGDRLAKPLPYLADLREIGPDTLWALYAVGAADWAAKSGPPDSAADGRNPWDLFHPEMRNGLVELIDAKSGATLVAVRLSHTIRGFLDDSLAYDLQRDDDGIWHAVVYKFSLTRTP